VVNLCRVRGQLLAGFVLGFALGGSDLGFK